MTGQEMRKKAANALFSTIKRVALFLHFVKQKHRICRAFGVFARHVVPIGAGAGRGDKYSVYRIEQSSKLCHPTATRFDARPPCTIRPTKNWSLWVMSKRSLRVIKWLGTVPAVGICTFCARNFKVPPDSLKRTSDAQGNLQKQFGEHVCNREDDPAQTAARFAKEDD